MIRHRLNAALAASVLLLGTAPAAFAQQPAPHVNQEAPPRTAGSEGGVTGRNVTASTYGAGTINGQSGSGVSGGGEAQAVDGTASTRSDAKYNERRSMQRSVANAQTEDERAVSRTRTNVNTKNETIRSTTMSRYKERGAPPVREVVRTVSTPEGTTTRTKNKGPK